MVATPNLSDALSGLVYSRSDVACVEGFPNVLFRRELSIANPIPGSKKAPKVALVSGGGSGHEPAHAGFLGRGMLSAVACGEVFASPSVDSVLQAILAVTGPAGCLLIVKNYTGDRLNFGLAAEIAKADFGLQVEIVVVGDDCALNEGRGITGRRGLAGVILVHKAAGAAAERGAALEDVARIAQGVADSLITLGTEIVVVRDSSSSSSSSSTEIVANVGRGIHGEPGAEELALGVQDSPWKDDFLVHKMLSTMLTFAKTRRHKKRAVLLVNNLGSTGDLKLFAWITHAISFLQSEGIHVERVGSGRLVTSLEMNGASLTLLLEQDNDQVGDFDDYLSLLDDGTDAPHWPPLGRGEMIQIPSIAGLLNKTTTRRTTNERNPSMSPSQVVILSETLIKAPMVALIAAKERLNECDRVAGDGDCGTIMSNGASAVLEDIQTAGSLHAYVGGGDHDHDQDGWMYVFANLARAIAKSVRRSMGGSSGALYDIFFNAAAAVATATAEKEEEEEGGGGGLHRPIDLLTIMFRSGIEAVMKYGGAGAGDRTMIDAMLPALHVLERQKSKRGMDKEEEGEGEEDDGVLLVAAAAESGKKGAEDTKRMSAQAGRASYVQSESAIQAMEAMPDPGALAVQIWLESLAQEMMTRRKNNTE